MRDEPAVCIVCTCQELMQKALERHMDSVRYLTQDARVCNRLPAVGRNSFSDGTYLPGLLLLAC